MGNCCSTEAEPKPKSDVKPAAAAAAADASAGAENKSEARASEVKVIELDLAAQRRKTLFEDLPPLVVDEKVTLANTARWEEVTAHVREQQKKQSSDATAHVESQEEALGLTNPSVSDDDHASAFLRAVDKKVEEAKVEPATVATNEAYWEKLFNGYDINGDGVLDVREHRLMYAESLKQQKEKAPEFVKSHYDALTDLIMNKQMKYALTAEGKQKLTDAVKRFDAIVPLVTEKVVAALTTNLQYATARADKVFRAMDTDNDGKVSLADVKQLYKSSSVMGLEVSYYVMTAIEATPFPGKRL